MLFHDGVLGPYWDIAGLDLSKNLGKHKITGY